MPKVLANDGIDPAGLQILQDAGLEVSTDKIEQGDLMEGLKDYEAILVRSATQVRQDLIDAHPQLSLIGRGGVGMDNIDVDYAREKGLAVVNTPAASSLSVAELSIAHLFGGVRFLHDSNREMPANGSDKFKELKKKYAKGSELKGKTLGVIGFGRIGQETARIALGIGMNVVAYDMFPKPTTIKVPIADQEVSVMINPMDLGDLLAQSDAISLHIPHAKGDDAAIGQAQFDQMKDGVMLVNCARGGCVSEAALLDALNSGKVAYAGIDVFEEEPTNNTDLLAHPNVSLTPHIGASTGEAQRRVGEELAQQVVDHFNSK
jgi:D-3-phosphoglycerate dehydrogenase